MAGPLDTGRADIRPDVLAQIDHRLASLESAATAALMEKGQPASSVSCTHYLNMRYEGTDVAVMVSGARAEIFAEIIRRGYAPAPCTWRQLLLC